MDDFRPAHPNIAPISTTIHPIKPAHPPSASIPTFELELSSKSPEQIPQSVCIPLPPQYRVTNNELNPVTGHFLEHEEGAKPILIRTVIQCAGTTKKGNRCPKVVRTNRILNASSPNETIEKYCIWHRCTNARKPSTDNVIAIHCAAKTSKGKRCTKGFHAEHPSESSDLDASIERFCHWHRNSKRSDTENTPMFFSNVKCSGKTKEGKGCSRWVRRVPLSSKLNPNTPVFCYQHLEKVMDQSGFYSHKGKEDWVEFSGEHQRL